MYWFRVKVGGERNTICNASTGSCNSDKYNVERNNVGCQLTVKHLELSDAGSVICEILISQTTYEGTALLLVFSTLCPIIFTLIMNLESIEMLEVKNSADYFLWVNAFIHLYILWCMLLSYRCQCLAARFYRSFS